MVYLRDYHHASKIFRSNVYEKAPKFKFLFHVYFQINPEALPEGLTEDSNFGLYVKDIKLPSFSINTLQLNQYNRKRIVQTKIKYDPVNVTFHDDNASTITQLWNSYYIYYYRDGSKPQITFPGARGNRPTQPAPGFNKLFNTRSQYINSVAGDYDWGYTGEPSVIEDDQEPIKRPFFNNITVFSFYQHQWTAYTFINPLITNFQHDTHSYNESNGVMQNTMTFDYETVVYNYGALDGNEPSNIVKGFGLQASYDRTKSPLSNGADNSLVDVGSQGMVPAAGGFVNNNFPNNFDPFGTYFYNRNPRANVVNEQGNALAQMRAYFGQEFPSASPLTSPIRNTNFVFPSAGLTPSNLGVAGSPPVGASEQPNAVTNESVAGQQVTSLNNKNK